MIEIEFFGYLISLDPTLILGPGMFITLIIVLLSGYPVAFCLGGIAVLFSILGIALGEIAPIFITALPQRILGFMANFTLLAIPAFVFMGAMLETSGVAERLLESMGRLLGRLRGGLALAVVVIGALAAYIAYTQPAVRALLLPLLKKYDDELLDLMDKSMTAAQVKAYEKLDEAAQKHVKDAMLRNVIMSAYDQNDDKFATVVKTELKDALTEAKKI